LKCDACRRHAGCHLAREDFGMSCRFKPAFKI
jgi:hypothetical protein